MKLIIYLFIFVITIIIVSCVGQPNSQVEFIYPLKMGDQWIYSRTWTFSNIKPDTFQISTPQFSNIVVINEGHEIIDDSVNVFKVKSIESYQNENNMGVNYYQDKSDGLYLCAYSSSGGGSLALPKNSQEYSITFKGKKYNNIEKLIRLLSEFPIFNKSINDSIIFETPPLIVLQYPLQIGTHWNYRHSYNPWRINKEIVDSEEIVVPAGRYYCHKIQWLYDMDHDNNWDDDIFVFDYIASIGLIKRQFLIKNVHFTDVTGSELGTADFEDKFILSGTRIAKNKIENNPVW